MTIFQEVIILIALIWGAEMAFKIVVMGDNQIAQFKEGDKNYRGLKITIIQFLLITILYWIIFVYMLVQFLNT